jgi:protoporphyrin/coproporphyrin ferrochelatase
VTTAVLVMAYGTPRSLEDVEAFYTDIRRGRPPTPEQLAELVARYAAIGGTSPLVERTEAQRDGLQRSLDERAPGTYEVVLGYRHAAPSIEAAVDDIAARGIGRIIGLVLAPHHSALSVGQYQRRVDDAARAYGIPVVGIERWHLLAAYVDFLAHGVRDLLPTLPANTKVVFTAHSLPARVLADGDAYRDQLRETAAVVAAAAGLAPWAGWGTAWQSAGRTPEPWLQPDLLSVIDGLGASEGADGLLVCPCGFVADHLEVLYDLDVEAARRAEANGLAFARTPCVNDDPAVLAALADLVVEVDR